LAVETLTLQQMKKMKTIYCSKNLMGGNSIVKKTVAPLALFAALFCVQSAVAQNYKGTPKPTIQDYGPFAGANAKFTDSNRTTNASGTCGNPAAHCLFYGGDFTNNPVGPTVANGLANENDLLISGSPYGAATWVAFTVPSGQTWAVTGVFANNFSTYGVLDQAPNQPTSAAYWAIQTGIEPGNAGTLVASGTNGATATATGRSSFGLSEYTIQVEGLSVTLTSGTYWLAVVPQCTNSGDPYCEGVFFLSDVEYIDAPAKNAVGHEPQDLGYFDSPAFGLSFDPANGPLGACGGIGCDSFSAGVLGHVEGGNTK
jgi:hypothetical protein